MKKEAKTIFLEGRFMFYHNIGNDGSLSLAAKGLMLILGNMLPFNTDKELIKKLCNSDEKEIYAALCELADKGYLSFNDIAMYLGHNSKCDDCKDRR